MDLSMGNECESVISTLANWSEMAEDGTMKMKTIPTTTARRMAIIRAERNNWSNEAIGGEWDWTSGTCMVRYTQQRTCRIHTEKT